MTDQRGIERPQDADADGTAIVDIGAMERYYVRIEGVVFHDENGDGILRWGESGCSGVTVYVDLDNDWQFDLDEPSAVTGASGSYTLDNVPPGVHFVRQVLSNDWYESAGVPGSLPERVSVGAPAGGAGGSYSSSPISGDGRFVAFSSWASNLVPGDTNDASDIFVFDRQQRTIERVSVNSQGNQANEKSSHPSISANGRYVAFASNASNLVPGDTIYSEDIFVFDRQQRTIERVSVDSSNPSISADGRYVAFSSLASNLVPDDTNNTVDIFVFDRQQGTTERVSVDSLGNQADDYCYSPSISADGRYVAFSSRASNLVPDDTNNADDVFVFDRQQRTIERVSVDSQGNQANHGSNDSPSISGDGRFVAFSSWASNLVPDDTNGDDDIFVFDRQQRTIELVSLDSQGNQANGFSSTPSISADGRYVAFSSYASNLVPGDTNNAVDIFVFDRQQRTIELVSFDSQGNQANDFSSTPSISADGRYVAFSSDASNLVPRDTNNAQDIFVFGRQQNTIELVSVGFEGNQANGDSAKSSISADGRYVAFSSDASNLVPDDTNNAVDIFVFDRRQRTIERVNIDSDGNQASEHSFSPSISVDGRYVAFSSFASNLVPDDTTYIEDIFVFDRQQRTIERVSVDPLGNQANGDSSKPSISADGRYVAFSSYASNLVPGDTNSTGDIFVFDHQQGTIERVSVDSLGNQANGDNILPTISRDGRYVAFSSDASNLVPGDTNNAVDIFVFDRQQRTIERVSVDSQGNQASENSFSPSICGNGRYVAFSSWASNLVPNDINGDNDIFVFDRQQRTIELVSLDSQGNQANEFSSTPSINADGRYVAFNSYASNLVPDDTNGDNDIFVFDRQQKTIERVSVDSQGNQANGNSRDSSISFDGRYVAFASDASNLVPGDTNKASDIFVGANWPAGQAVSETVLLSPGQSVTSISFGNRPVPGQIYGQLFEDFDLDGYFDAGETGLENWTVYLDVDHDGVLDTFEPQVVTDSSGRYAFTDLTGFTSNAPFTEYTVRQVPQEFWVQTTPRLIDGGVWTVQIGAGTVAKRIDFGNHFRGPGGQDLDVVAGRLFLDPNGNGIQDDAEDGLVGHTVYLDENNNGQLDAGEPQTVTTDDDTNTSDVNEAGDYLFEGLKPGVHIAHRGEGRLAADDADGERPDQRQYGDPQLGNSQYVATGDFDGDGNVDMVVAYGDSIALLRNDGAGGFSSPVDIFVGRTGSLPFSIVAAKLDNDDDLDLAIANNYTSDLTILLNDGTGGFQQASGSPILVGNLPSSVAAGDLDGDGDTDLAVANKHDNNLSILRNNGLARFTLDARKLPVGGGPNAVVMGRFYDDGQGSSGGLDLAVANYKTDNLSIWLNNGQGGFTTRIEIPAGDGPSGLTTGDLDRDGDQDLIVSNLNSQDVSLLRNNGFGSFAKLPDELSAGAGVYSVVAIDMDHDTDPDIVVTNGIAQGVLNFTLLRNLSTPAEIMFGPPRPTAPATYRVGPFRSPSPLRSSTTTTVMVRWIKTTTWTWPSPTVTPTECRWCSTAWLREHIALHSRGWTR